MRESLYLEDFSGNRSVHFPSALDTIAEEDSSRVIFETCKVLDRTLCLTLSDTLFRNTSFESVITSNDSIFDREPSKQVFCCADHLDRRPIHSHIINRDSESRQKAERAKPGVCGSRRPSYARRVQGPNLVRVSLGDRRTRDTSVRNLQVVGDSTFVLSVENDNDFRSRCE